MRIICNACKGLKKYWGIGMMRQHDCEACSGTGFQELIKNIDENKQEVIANASTETKEVKKAAAKKAVASKEVLKKKATKKTVKKTAE